MTITNGYATLAEAQAWIRLDDTADDTLLELAVESASRMIDRYCSRHFYAATSATARLVQADESVLVTTDDISSTTGLVVKTDDDGDGTFEITWSAGNYQLEPLNELAKGRPVYRIRAVGSLTWPLDSWGQARVEITARWGWPAVPLEVKQACLMQASHLLKRRDAPFGLITSPDLLPAGRVPSTLDATVRALLDPLRRVTHTVAG